MMSVAPVAEPAPADRADECYADAANRSVAFLIDAIFLAVLSFVAAVAVSVLVGPVVRFEPGGTISIDRTLAALDGLLATSLSAVYFVTGWAQFGRTPGMRVVGARIATEAGLALPLGRAVTRWIVLCGPLAAAALLVPFVSGVGDAIVDAVVLAWFCVLLGTTVVSHSRQGLHDRVAGSVVTKRAAGRAFALPEAKGLPPR